VEKNPSLAVFLSPYVGYLEASKIAKQALKENRAVKDIALKKRVLQSQEARRIFSQQSLLGRKRPISRGAVT
jgi:aspartate ammonia-lyase